MGSAASSAEQDAQIKAFMQKNLTHVRELLHAVTNDPCPVLFSSDTPDKEDFRRMLKVAGAEYDSKTASADDLVAAIKSLADIHGSFNSIALACHGPSSGSCEGFQWSISDKIVVTSADDLKEGTDAYKVLAALGNAVNEKGRVDLLSCELLKTDEGKAILAAIEVATKCNFAASSDLTGNPAAGGDWIMESDGVNVKDIYFTGTDEFTGTFDLIAATRSRCYDRDEAIEILQEVVPGAAPQQWIVPPELIAHLESLGMPPEQVEQQEQEGPGGPISFYNRSSRPNIQEQEPISF